MGVKYGKENRIVHAQGRELLKENVEVLKGTSMVKEANMPKYNISYPDQLRKIFFNEGLQANRFDI